MSPTIAFGSKSSIIVVKNFSMTREEKSIAIEGLAAQLASSNIIYLADISGLNAETTSNLRRACFKAGMKLEVVKNTLFAKKLWRPLIMIMEIYLQY